MFDKELFLSICREYGVELSDKYDKPMIRIDGVEREITEAIFEEVVLKKNLKLEDCNFKYRFDELLEACQLV